MVKVNEKAPMSEADVSRIMEAFGSMTGSVRRRAHDEHEPTAASSTGRPRTDPLMETEEAHFGKEQQVPNPDPANQRLEAQMLRDAIINFSERNQIDTTDLLDQIYAEITGLAAQTRRPYQGPPFVPQQGHPFPAAYLPQQTMPPPMPATHNPIDVPVPTEHIPDEALITWGKHTGKRFQDLHQDLKYVRWVLSNGSRFSSEEAMAVTDYVEHHYYLTSGKRKVLMRRTEPGHPDHPHALPQRIRRDSTLAPDFDPLLREMIKEFASQMSKKPRP